MSTILYSHGFGVQKDDRGLFTDFEAALPNYEHVMFDYNSYDEFTNTLRVTPFDEQVKAFEAHLDAVPADETVDIIAHSQGCIIVALAKLRDVRSVILLTPPVDLDFDRLSAVFGRSGSEINLNADSKLIRRDGSTTIVPAGYWQSIASLKPLELYENLANRVPVTIVKATEDEVVGDTRFSDVLNPHVLAIKTNHNFNGEGRDAIISKLGELL